MSFPLESVLLQEGQSIQAYVLARMHREQCPLFDHTDCVFDLWDVLQRHVQTMGTREVPVWTFPDREGGRS